MDVNNGVAKAAPIFDKDQILQYAISNGILDLPDIAEQIEMNERKRFLDMHTHKKWKGTDGKWCTYLPDDTKPKNRALCKRGTEEELDNAIINYWKKCEDNPTIKEVFKEWNDRKLQRGQIKASSHTLHISTFNRFYPDMGNRKIKSVSPQEWEDFLCDCIVKYKLSSKTFSGLKSITKGFLKRAKKRGLINMDVETFFLEMDVSDNDFKTKIINEEDEVFFDDEVEKIMNYIRNNPDIRNVGIALMFVTGIRVGELVALKHEDFDKTSFKIKRTMTRFKSNEVDGYVCAISELPKTPAGYRTVFIPQSQQWILDKIRLSNPFGDFVFVEKGERLNTDNIRKRLYRICDILKIPRRSPHKIRKTYGSILLDNGVDAKTITNQMGHTDISCTEQFYHRNRKRVEQRQAIFDNIPELMAK